MTFGQIIKKLRRDADMTQERLAEVLSVSAQAVSRWETDTGMPDVSLLPPLANLFGVTTDHLLGVDITKKDENIAAIRKKANAYSERGYFAEAREILEQGLKQYPNNYRMMRDLMYVSYYQYRAASDAKDTELAEKYKVSVAQLCIRFIVQKGAVPIPKSANPDRIRNNADVFGFEISDEDMERIASLRVYGRIGDPPSVPRTHQVVGF